MRDETCFVYENKGNNETNAKHNKSAHDRSGCVLNRHSNTCGSQNRHFAGIHNKSISILCQGLLIMHSKSVIDGCHKSELERRMVTVFAVPLLIYRETLTCCPEALPNIVVLSLWFN